MKSIKLVAAAAVALTTAGTAAYAGPPDITSPSCDRHVKGIATYDVCFTGGYPYRTGHYASLACSDPYKGVRYVTVKPFLGKARKVLTCTYN